MSADQLQRSDRADGTTRADGDLAVLEQPGLGPRKVRRPLRIPPTIMHETYETDFYAWANAQAELLRSGRLAEADLVHIAEEIESLGKSELRELENRLGVLFVHLLKWRFQPTLRSRSWKLSIKEQRRRLRRHLAQNPSLKAELAQAREDAYGDAVLEAARQTGLAEDLFPAACPFTDEQALDDDWWPA